MGVKHGLGSVLASASSVSWFRFFFFLVCSCVFVCFLH